MRRAFGAKGISALRTVGTSTVMEQQNEPTQSHVAQQQSWLIQRVRSCDLAPDLILAVEPSFSLLVE